MKADSLSAPVELPEHAPTHYNVISEKDKIDGLPIVDLENPTEYSHVSIAKMVECSVLQIDHKLIMWLCREGVPYTERVDITVRTLTR